MDLLDLMKNRYSVRKFCNKTISDENLNKILKSAMLAPTACNKQPFRIIVINNDDGFKKLSKCVSNDYLCPVVLLVLTNKNECWIRDYDGADSGYVDASIVTTHMMLEASALGIGSVWVMHFNKKNVIKEFVLPNEYEPVSMLYLGYEKDGYVPSIMHEKSKNISDIVYYNEFISD